MTSGDSYRAVPLYILPTMHCTSQQEMRKAPPSDGTPLRRKNNFPTFQFCHSVTPFALAVHSCRRLMRGLVMNVFHKRTLSRAGPLLALYHCEEQPAPR